MDFLLLFLLLNQRPPVKQGPHFFEEVDSLFIGKIELRGNLVFSRKSLGEYLPQKGSRFSESVFFETNRKIIDFYLQRGFPFVVVEPSNFSRDSQFINWNLEIKPGELKRIGDVYYSGNSYTEREYLNRILGVEKNEVFNEKKIEKGIANIEGLPYIDVDSFNLRTTKSRNLLDIIFYIRERDRGNIRGSAGYSQRTGFSGFFEMENRNLFGSGRQLKLRWIKEGEDFQEELIQYLEPFFLGLPFDMKVNLRHNYLKGEYNLTLISSGLSYTRERVDVIFLIGGEYLQDTLGQVSGDLFYESILKFRNNSLKGSFSFRQRRRGGWDLSTGFDIEFWNFQQSFEYFKISDKYKQRFFYRIVKGYPGLKVTEGINLESKYIFGNANFSLYPLFNGFWDKSEWLTSYGFGMNVKNISLEYYIPWNEKPDNGRIYILFDSGE